jgi:hypothetical protein
MAYEFTFMQVEGLSGRSYVEKHTQQGAALMKDIVGNIVWAILGAAVIFGLMALNAYFQRINRIEEEEDRIRLLGSDPLKRSAASQDRRPDDI